jgi:predicted solute-binding protein
MATRLRVGAVSYLNARPLVHGLEGGAARERIDLSRATPAVLADRLAAGTLDVALLPVIELARIPDLELAPGLGISTLGRSRSVLLVSKVPIGSIDSLALDPESRTSNALCLVLLAELWSRSPRLVEGATDLAASLTRADAAVRIGDKALFEPLPGGLHVLDLGQAWTRETGRPFVFAAWCGRRGMIDADLLRLLHEARRAGVRAVERIAADYAWNGEHHPDLARDYLTHCIRFDLGASEIQAIEQFLAAACRVGVIDAVPPIRLALEGCAARSMA